MIELGVGLGIGVLAITVLFGLLIVLKNRALDKVPPIRKVVLEDQPTWLDQSTADELMQSVMSVVRQDPADKELPANVAEKLSHNPWVQSVAPAGVVNNYDGSLIVRCIFRRPIALVNSRGVMIPIDDQAVVLPGRFLPTPVRPGSLKVVLGVVSVPPQVGREWHQPDVLAAVELLKFIEPHPFSREVMVIDVSNYTGRRDLSKPHLLLSTSGQAVIYWGRAIGTEGRLEIPAQQKLDNLEKLFVQLGSLNELTYADLRGRDVRGKLRDGKEVSSR